MRLLKHQLWAMPLVATLAFCITANTYAADGAPKETKIKDITLKIPTTWKSLPPSNRLRLAQFELPAAKGETVKSELVIYSFGGGGGGNKANLSRWIKQFSGPDRTAKLTTGTCPQGEYYFADLAGTYNMSIGPPRLQKTTPVANSRMLGVILQVKGKGVYFLKAVGPKKTIDSIAKQFRATFDADEKQEKEYKLER